MYTTGGCHLDVCACVRMCVCVCVRAHVRVSGCQSEVIRCGSAVEREVSYLCLQITFQALYPSFEDAHGPLGEAVRCRVMGRTGYVFYTIASA